VKPKKLLSRFVVVKPSTEPYLEASASEISNWDAACARAQIEAQRNPGVEVTIYEVRRRFFAQVPDVLELHEDGALTDNAGIKVGFTLVEGGNECPQ
jgi:hypothetical protein